MFSRFSRLTILSLLLLGAFTVVLPVHAATLVQSKQCLDNTGNSANFICAFNSSISSGNFIVVVWGANGQNVNSVTISDTRLTIYTTSNIKTDSFSDWSVISYGQASSSGSDTVSVLPGAFEYSVIDLYEISGLTTPTATFLYAPDGSQPGNTPQTTTSSSFNSGAFLVASVPANSGNSGTNNAGTGFTLDTATGTIGIHWFGQHSLDGSGISSPTNFAFSGALINNRWTEVALVLSPPSVAYVHTVSPTMTLSVTVNQDNTPFILQPFIALSESITSLYTPFTISGGCGGCGTQTTTTTTHTTTTRTTTTNVYQAAASSAQAAANAATLPVCSTAQKAVPIQCTQNVLNLFFVIGIILFVSLIAAAVLQSSGGRKGARR